MASNAILPGPRDRSNLVNGRLPPEELRKFNNWSAAQARAMQQFVADLPDPTWFADGLGFAAACALERCVMGRAGWQASGEADARELRPWGLCEARGRFLTNFGCDVRRALLGVPE